MTRSINKGSLPAMERAAAVVLSALLALACAVPSGHAWAASGDAANAKQSVLSLKTHAQKGALLASLILSQSAEGTSAGTSVTLDALSRYPNTGIDESHSDDSSDKAIPLYGNSKESGSEVNSAGRYEARRIATLFEYGYLQTYNPAIDGNQGGTLETDGNKVVLTLVSIGMSMYEICAKSIIEPLFGVLKKINVVTLFDLAGDMSVPGYATTSDDGGETVANVFQQWFSEIGLDADFLDRIKWVSFTVISLAFTLVAIRVVSDMRRSKGRAASKARGYLIRMVTIILALPLAFAVTGLANEAAKKVDDEVDKVATKINDDVLLDTLEFASKTNFNFKLDGVRADDSGDGSDTDPLPGYSPKAGGDYVAKLNDKLSGVADGDSDEKKAKKRRTSALEKIQGYINGDTATVNDYFDSIRSGDSRGIAALKGGTDDNLGTGQSYMRQTWFGGDSVSTTYVPAMNQAIGSAASLGAVVDLRKDTVFFESKGDASTADDNSNSDANTSPPSKDSFSTYHLEFKGYRVVKDPGKKEDLNKVRDKIVEITSDDGKWAELEEELKKSDWESSFLNKLKSYDSGTLGDLYFKKKDGSGDWRHPSTSAFFSRDDLKAQSKYDYKYDSTDEDAYKDALEKHEKTKASISSSFKGAKKSWYNIGSLGTDARGGGEGTQPLYLDAHEFDAMDMSVVDLREPNTYIYGAKLAQGSTRQSSSIYSYIFSPVDTDRSQVVNPYTGKSQFKLAAEPSELKVKEQFAESDNDTIDMEKAGTQKASDEKGFGAVWIANAVRHAAWNMYAGIDDGSFSTQSVAFLLQSKYGKDTRSLLYNAYQATASETGSSKNTGANGIAFYRYVIPHVDDSDLAVKLSSLVMAWITAGWASIIGLIALLTAPLIGALWRSLRGFFMGLFKGDIFGLAEYGLYLLAIYGGFVLYQAAILAGVLFMGLLTSIFGFASTLFTSAGDGVDAALGWVPGAGGALTAFFSGIVSVIGMICLSALIIVVLSWPVTSLKVNGRQRDVNLITAIILLPFNLVEGATANFDQYRQQLYGSRRGSGKVFGERSGSGAKALAGNLAKGAVLAGGAAGTVGVARKVGKAAEEGALSSGLSAQEARKQRLAATAQASRAGFGNAVAQANRVAGSVRSGNALRAAGSIATGISQGRNAATVGAADAVERASGQKVGRPAAGPGAHAALTDKESRVEAEKAGLAAAGDPGSAPSETAPNVDDSAAPPDGTAPVEAPPSGTGSNIAEDAAQQAGRGPDRQDPDGQAGPERGEGPDDGARERAGEPAGAAADAAAPDGEDAARAGSGDVAAAAAYALPAEQPGGSARGQAGPEDGEQGRGEPAQAAADAAAPDGEDAARAGSGDVAAAAAAASPSEGPEPARAGEPGTPPDGTQPDAAGRNRPAGEGGTPAGARPSPAAAGPARGDDRSANAANGALARPDAGGGPSPAPAGRRPAEAGAYERGLRSMAGESREAGESAAADAAQAARQSRAAKAQLSDPHKKGVPDAVAASGARQQSRDDRNAARGGTFVQRTAKAAESMYQRGEVWGGSSITGTVAAARTAAAAAPEAFRQSQQAGESTLRSVRKAIDAGRAGISQGKDNAAAERDAMLSDGRYAQAAADRSRKLADAAVLDHRRKSGLADGLSFAGAAAVGEDEATEARDALNLRAARARDKMGRYDKSMSSRAAAGNEQGVVGHEAVDDRSIRQEHLDVELPDGSVKRMWVTVYPDGTVIDNSTNRPINR